MGHQSWNRLSQPCSWTTEMPTRGLYTRNVESLFLWNSDSDCDPIKTCTTTQTPAKNQTPTLGLTVWHTDCVLKDDLREILNSCKVRNRGFAFMHYINPRLTLTLTIHDWHCTLEVVKTARTVHHLKSHSTTLGSTQSRNSTCPESESPLKM